MIRRALTVGLAALVLALPLDAAAQGRGRPKRPEAPRPAQAGPPTRTSTTGAAAPATATSTPSTLFRQYGSWLDDASTTARGAGSTGIGLGYWRADGASQIDVPMIDLSYGLTNRVQVSATVPFYRVSYQGATARGLDDVYLSGKVTAIDPEGNTHKVGLAISPVVEVLSAGFADDGRVHWALPVSVELGGDALRVYGSAGYFSRGAVFTGGALEYTTPAGTVLTGALTQSRSLSDGFAGLPGTTGAQRVDVSVSVAHPVTDVVAAYGSVGRSLTSIADGGTSLALSAGVSFRFAASTP